MSCESATDWDGQPVVGKVATDPGEGAVDYPYEETLFAQDRHQRDLVVLLSFVRLLNVRNTFESLFGELAPVYLSYILQDFLSFCDFIFGNQPPHRLWYEPQEHCYQQTWCVHNLQHKLPRRRHPSRSSQKDVTYGKSKTYDTVAHVSSFRVDQFESWKWYC
jgi:hypothetical protein